MASIDNAKVSFCGMLNMQGAVSINEIALIGTLIDYLELEAGDEKGSTVSGLKREHMLNQVLAYKYPINNILPVPSYKKRSGVMKMLLQVQ